MGKKKDKKTKGKGAEKTALKTEKKADKKSKKLLADKGEEDVEALIADFQKKDKRREAVIEEKVPPPSPRCNMSLTPHPDKEELIMFGGEYFNGSKTFMYNDLLVYNIKTREWTHVQAPGAPPPRCSHQAVALRQGGGQLWIFGGEFASPTQSQFYHYKDLWVYHFKTKHWDQIKVPGAPTARSGHRMVVYKRDLVVFGGFHDNIRDYKYFNDVHTFNLDTFTWAKVDVVGNGPSARSGCQMAVMLETPGGVMVYGGYSKERVKKDVDQGRTHTDMFVLRPEVKSAAGGETTTRWRWLQIKQHGTRPSIRSGFSLVATPGNRALFFGGVFDEEEDEESVEGMFFNDLYTLDLEKATWHEVILRGKKDLSEKKKRRKKKLKLDAEMDEGISSDEGDVEEVMEDLSVGEVATETHPASEATQAVVNELSKVTSDDGIFTVTVGPQVTEQSGPAPSRSHPASSDVFMPCARMNALLAVKQGLLYLYGGLYEEGDRQVTLSDLYALDLHKLDEWITLIANDKKSMEWQESDSSSDDESDDDENDDAVGAASGGVKRHHDDSDDEEDDDDDEDSEMEEDVPAVKSGEALTEYFGRSKDFWLRQADLAATKEGHQITQGNELKTRASSMAETFHNKGH